MDLILHDIPETVGRALRARAEATESTIDSIAADALSRALGVQPAPSGPPYHDLDWFFGGGCMDEATLAALAELDVVHPEQDHAIDEIIAADAARDAAHMADASQ